MSRVFNSLLTGQTATDSAHFFASSAGWAQPTLVVRCPPSARSLAITGECAVFRSGAINLQLAVCVEDFGVHHAYVLVNRGKTTKHYYCWLYGSQKCLESLTAALLGRQPPIQPIFSLAAWVGTAHAGGALPAVGALSRDHGGGSVSISSVFSQQTVCPRNSGLIPQN